MKTEGSYEDKWNLYLLEYEKTLIEFNRLISQETAKESVFCKEGCSYCCYQVFNENTAQVEIIARRLKKSPELMAEFLKQNDNRKKLLKLKENEIREVSEEKYNGEFLRKWLLLKIPCALLSNGICLVYDIRPLTCSSFISNSAPRVCSIDPKGYTTQSIVNLRRDFFKSVVELNEKYDVKPELIFDLSWHLDRTINPDGGQTGD